MRDYWGEHGARNPIDYDADPDGTVVCCGGSQPLWQTRYHDRLQRKVFSRLLAQAALSPRRFPRRALDVGCGAGRWCRVLGEANFKVTGIDMQQSLVESNARRYPQMEFETTSLRDFQTDEPFDLISSVLVYQHIPYDEQAEAAQKLAAMLVPGGYLLLIEGLLHDDVPHFFTHGRDGWARVFAAQEMTLVDRIPLNYEPTLQTLRRLRPSSRPELAAAPAPVQPAGFSAVGAALRVGATMDMALQPMLLRAKPSMRATHCGFLFRSPVVRRMA